LLAETELGVSHDLSDAARNVAITHQLLETNYNRVAADLRQVDVLNRRYRDGSDNINFLLQAQRQAVTSLSEFYRSLASYNLAIRDFHREKGSLLAYNHVQLAEGPWAPGAAADAYEVGRFLHPRPRPEKTIAPTPLTSGPFDPSAIQNTSGMGTPPADGVIYADEVGELPMEDQPPQPETPLQADPTLPEPIQPGAFDDGLLESGQP
jgi:hypothetical protein